jgi:hypothetical protein
MRKLLLSLALLLIGVAQPAYAAIEARGYSLSEHMHTSISHQEVEPFFNNSGGVITSGSVVIADTSGSGLNGANSSGSSGIAPGNSDMDVAGSDGDVTNLGTYITTTTTADDERVIGINLDDCADQTYCSVVTRGPVRARCLDASDAITAGATGAVGTSTSAGQVGAGKGVGFALEDGSGHDNSTCMIFVNPGYGT